LKSSVTPTKNLGEEEMSQGATRRVPIRDLFRYDLRLGPSGIPVALVGLRSRIRPGDHPAVLFVTAGPVLDGDSRQG
jgi:hypothetical protein